MMSKKRTDVKKKEGCEREEEIQNERVALKSGN